MLCRKRVSISTISKFAAVLQKKPKTVTLHADSSERYLSALGIANNKIREYLDMRGKETSMKFDAKACLRLGLTLFSALSVYLLLACGGSGRQPALFRGRASAFGSGDGLCREYLMAFYEKHIFGRAEGGARAKARRPLCMTLAFATLLMIVVLLLVLVIPELVSCIRVIAAGVPAVAQAVTKWV